MNASNISVIASPQSLSWRNIPGHVGYKISSTGLVKTPNGKLCKIKEDKVSFYFPATGKTTTKKLSKLHRQVFSDLYETVVQQKATEPVVKKQVSSSSTQQSQKVVNIHGKNFYHIPGSDRYYMDSDRKVYRQLQSGIMSFRKPYSTSSARPNGTVTLFRPDGSQFRFSSDTDTTILPSAWYKIPNTQASVRYNNGKYEVMNRHKKILVEYGKTSYVSVKDNSGNRLQKTPKEFYQMAIQKLATKSQIVSETAVSRFKKEPVQLEMPVVQPVVQTKLPLQIQTKPQVKKQFSFKKPEQKLSFVTAKSVSSHIYSIENNDYMLAYKIGSSSDNVRFLVSSDLDKLKTIETIIKHTSQASLLDRIASLKLIGQQFGFTKMHQINFATKYVGIKPSAITISAKI